MKGIIKRVAMVTALAAAVSFSAGAQDGDYEVGKVNNYTNPQLIFGVRGGASITVPNFGGSVISSFPVLGFDLNYRLHDEKPIYLGIGVWFQGWWGEEDLDGDTQFEAGFKFPIVASWNFRLNRNCTLGPMVGPYVMGTTDYREGPARHFDVGLRLGCQFNWKKLYASAGGDFGFITHKELTYGNVHTNGTSGMLFITVGCNFVTK